jgi:hypothetical protein
VEQPTARTLRITTDDAGEAIPRLVQEIQDAGGQVVSSSEYHPSYDEVFAALVTQTSNGVPGDGEEDTDAHDRRAVAGAT